MHATTNRFLAGCVAVLALPAMAETIRVAQLSIDAFCDRPGCPTMDDKLAAEAAARRWLDELPDRTLTLSSLNETAFYENRALASGARIIDIHAYSGDWPTTLHFSGEVTSDMSVAEVQARVHSFSHDGFPTPGLRIDHWVTRARTPSTHVTDGIEILEVAEGHLVFQVRTTFYALGGFDTRMPDIQDISTPEEAYFLIEEPFLGDARVTYRVDGF